MERNVENKAMAAAFGAKDIEELAARYANWANSYDVENAAAGYRMPQICGAYFARHVPRGTIPILDAGCGTGLAGEFLSVLGYRDLTGIDLSESMLTHAARTKAYATLRPMALGGPLDFGDQQFGAVITSGVFTEGHAPFTSFDELIRITRKGGYHVFNVRNDIYENHGFRMRQEALEAEGRWRLVERSEPFRPFTIKEPDILARVFVYQVVGD